MRHYVSVSNNLESFTEIECPLSRKENRIRINITEKTRFQILTKISPLTSETIRV